MRALVSDGATTHVSCSRCSVVTCRQLGVIVYSLLYRYVLNDMEAFFKFVIIALPVLGLLGVAFMKHVPREGESGHQPVSRAHESTTELTSPKRSCLGLV